MRAQPRRSLPAAWLERIGRAALPGSGARTATPLGDGLRNSNFKLDLGAEREPVVLRIYEHDPSLCQKEVDLMRLVSGAVPVPEVISAEPQGREDLPPFMLMRWIEGVTFRDLKRTGDTDAIAQAGYAVGKTLAAVGRFGFEKSGWIAPGPAVTAPLLEGADPMPRFVDLCLASENLQARMPADLRDRTHALIWRMAPRLADLDCGACLVHGDFNRRNLVLRRDAGSWRVAAVLDWEFAVAGAPLADVGNFLCYERAAHPLAEPHFSTGYVDAGGKLPQDWRRFARVINLLGLCESLSHHHLPPEFVPELVELVRATIEDRDPAL